MKTVADLSMRWEGRIVEAVEIEDDCHTMLALIAQDTGTTIESQIQRILADGMLPCFADAIRLKFRRVEEEEG